MAHPELAAGLDLSSYRSITYERLSIQSCRTAGAQQAEQAQQAQLAGEAAAGDGGVGGRGVGREQRRLGGGPPPAYVFIYPNLMVNRQGKNGTSRQKCMRSSVRPS